MSKNTHHQDWIVFREAEDNVTYIHLENIVSISIEESDGPNPDSSHSVFVSTTTAKYRHESLRSFSDAEESSVDLIKKIELYKLSLSNRR